MNICFMDHYILPNLCVSKTVYLNNKYMGADMDCSRIRMGCDYCSRSRSMDFDNTIDNMDYNKADCNSNFHSAVDNTVVCNTGYSRSNRKHRVSSQLHLALFRSAVLAAHFHRRSMVAAVVLHPFSACRPLNFHRLALVLVPFPMPR